MEDRQKRPPEHEITGEYSDKKQRYPVPIYENNYIDNSDDILACLSVDEETMGELMDLLDKEEETSTQATRVKFITDPYSLQQQIFRSYSTYVTINGNDESCGSSFSDSESSFMASIDVGNVFGNIRGGGAMSNNISDGGACSSSSSSGEDEEVVARYLVTDGDEEAVRETNGSDCFDWEDVLLAKFLGEDKI